MPRKLPPVAFDFKAARKARKYSQQKTAVLLHATQPSISRWEKDGTMPEIYKMAWLLYWQLEDMKHDAGSNKRAGKSKPRKRSTESSARGTDGCNEGSRDSVDESEGEES
jgi:transcriptional regulator with XRE-family HTH domain